MDLTDIQWSRLSSTFKVPQQGPGRLRQDPRPIMNGILWVLRTGAPWKDIPGRYPPYQTCHRRYQEWVRQGLFKNVLKILAEDLQERGKIDVKECFIEDSICAVKKRGPGVGKTKQGKGCKIMTIADTFGLPVAILTESATPHEVTLVDETIEARFIEKLPE